MTRASLTSQKDEEPEKEAKKHISLSERASTTENEAPEKEPKAYISQPKRSTTTQSEEDEEDRENLITFKTWGIPAPRDKPRKFEQHSTTSI